MEGLFRQFWVRTTFLLYVVGKFKDYFSHAHMGSRLIFSQIYFTGVQPMRTLMGLSFFAGAFIMIQSSDRLTAIGGIQPLGDVLVLALFREVIPLMVLLVVIGRSVTGIASEIAAMKVQGELRLFRAYGVSVEGLLFFPRIVGPALGVMGLVVLTVMAAFAGAFLTAVIVYGIKPYTFIQITIFAFYPIDFLCFFLKAGLIPIIIFVIAVFEGNQLIGASYEIPIVTISAVMKSYIVSVVLFILVSSVFYLKEGISI